MLAKILWEKNYLMKNELAWRPEIISWTFNKNAVQFKCEKLKIKNEPTTKIFFLKFQKQYMLLEIFGDNWVNLLIFKNITQTDDSIRYFYIWLNLRFLATAALLYVFTFQITVFYARATHAKKNWKFKYHFMLKF